MLYPLMLSRRLTLLMYGCGPSEQVSDVFRLGNVPLTMSKHALVFYLIGEDQAVVLSTSIVNSKLPFLANSKFEFVGNMLSDNIPDSLNLRSGIQCVK